MSVVWTEVKQTGTFLLPSSGATLLTVLAPKCPLCVMTFISLPLLLVPLLMLGKSWLASRHSYDRQMLWPLLLGLLGALAIAVTKLWTTPAYLAIPGAALIITALALKTRADKLCHPAARYFRHAQESAEPFGFI